MLAPSVIDRLNRSDVDRLVVAFSGGIDSRVLLQLVYEAGPAASIHALHVNHGLHEDANAWQEHCRQVCDELYIPFTAVKVAVDTAG
ncbi:MAG: tRNA(Ile)-lysidine synthetase, partial [Pseudomonadales bacterium]|nr:tRNA(Ile)-lysidine synthetase [Pseudomonadales bacterium]